MLGVSTPWEDIKRKLQVFGGKTLKSRLMKKFKKLKFS
jgi:hypothetical protein